MNIFYLSKCPKESAVFMNNKHVVKMILETAQLLSTAHRLLDGNQTEISTENKNGKQRKKKIWQLDDKNLNDSLYQATHINHPSAKWVRESDKHYEWLFNHFSALLQEYTYRYEKTHKSSGLLSLLQKMPNNIECNGFVDPPQAMPDDVKNTDSVTAYRNYYMIYKNHFAQWKNRDVPYWYAA